MMTRIECTRCAWMTHPHYSIIDCVREKERAHLFGYISDRDRGDAHDAAFGEYCPICGGKTRDVRRWFKEDEL